MGIYDPERAAIAYAMIADMSRQLKQARSYQQDHGFEVSVDMEEVARQLIECRNTLDRYCGRFYSQESPEEPGEEDI